MGDFSKRSVRKNQGMLGLILMLVLFSIAFSVPASGKTLTLWGKQTKGWGMKNAETTGNRLTLTRPATVTKIRGDSQDYSIWSAVTPTNRTARMVVCGGRNRPSIISRVFQPGTYTVLPEAGTSVTISLTYQGGGQQLPSQTNQNGTSTTVAGFQPQNQGALDISGTWRWFGGVETVWIYRNGTSRASRGNRGRWSLIRPGAHPIYRIVWNNGRYVDTLTLRGDTLDGHERSGYRVWGKRISKGTGPSSNLANRLVSGTYRVTQGPWKSTWRLKVSNGRITGTSEWTCCPGHRIDPIKGKISGDTVVMERDCSGQGWNGSCRQIFRGHIQGDRIEGKCSGTGLYSGSLQTWVLYLNGGAGTQNQAVTQPPQQSTNTELTQNTFSCANNDNEEKGCCCFMGAHTYKFTPRYVTNVLARFDTGKGFNCKSTVNLDIDRGSGWETVKTIQANSSRGGSERAPIEVAVSVNDTIKGFKISDGCTCCIDSSKITLNAGSPGSSSTHSRVTDLPFFEDFSHGASKWILPSGASVRDGRIVWNTGNFNGVKLNAAIPMENIVIEFDGYAETNGINVWLQNSDKKGYTTIFGGWYNTQSGSDIGANEENRQLVAGKVWIPKKWQHYKIVRSGDVLAAYCEGHLIFKRTSQRHFGGYGYLRFDSWRAVIGIDNIHIYRANNLHTQIPSRLYVAAIRYRPPGLTKRDFYPPRTSIRFSYTLNTPLRPGDKIVKEEWYIDNYLQKTNTPGLTGTKGGFTTRFQHTFTTSGIYTVELRVFSTPTQFTHATQVIKIGTPSIAPLPNKVAITATPLPPYKAPVTITFTSNPLVPSGYWYVNGVFIRTGDNLTYTFKDPAIYRVELRRTAEGPPLAEKIISLKKGVGLLGAWRNKFQTRKKPPNLNDLEICSVYWVGGSGKWSPDCKSFIGGKIGAVDGYDFCTGQQADGYNTGWLVYSPKGSGKLKFKVFAFNFDSWEGYEKYAGELNLHGKKIIPGSINFVECKSRAATVQWKNEDGFICQARIWKTRSSSSYSKNVFIKGGIEDLGCKKGSGNHKNVTLTLWGKQTKGWGQKNAETTGSRLTLTRPATIIKIKGDSQDYCIRLAVTPTNLTARVVICGGRKRPSPIGYVLQPGTYTVLPEAGTSVTIDLKYVN